MCSKEPEPPPPTQPPPSTIVRDDGCVCPAPEEEKKKCEDTFSTCPYDPRFPDVNQTKHCYTSFVDYQRCVRLLGNYPGCKIFLKCYKALCPVAWTERWYEQMEKGTFPRKIYPPKPIIRPGPDDRCSEIEEEPPPPPPPCP